jgi:hypothetical protein
MSSLNNGVGNIKGTPAMITDILANRPSATNLAVGTIFIDSATGNWYQVGTNNTWSSTGGGGGGSADLQTVLNNGNSASDSNIILGTGDGLTSIELDQETNHWLKVNNESGNNNVIIDGNAITVTNTGDDEFTYLGAGSFNLKYNSSAYPRTYADNSIIGSENNIWSISLQNGYSDDTLGYISFNKKEINEYRIYGRKLDSGDAAGLKKFYLPYNNRESLTLATQEICPSNPVNIDLSTGDFTPSITEKGALYWIVVTGSATAGVNLNSTFTDNVVYTFYNRTSLLTFKITTGGVIYGTHTGLNAGLIQVMKNGNDFYIDHP